MAKKRIAVIGEINGITDLIGNEIKSMDIDFSMIDETKEYSDILRFDPDLMIFSIREDSSNLKELISAIDNLPKKIPFIVIAGNFGEQTIIDLMKTGARDIVLWKNIDLLPNSVANVLRNDPVNGSIINKKEIDNDELFHLVVNSIPDGIIIKTIEDDKYEYMNQSFLESMDLRNVKDMPAKLFKKLPQDYKEFLERNNDKLVSTDKGIISYEDKLKIKEKIKWFDVQKMILKDSKGKQDKLLGIFVDISNHKIKEQELEKSVSRFTKLFSNSPYPISIVRSSDGKIMDINDSYLDLLGLKYEETVGKTSEELGIWADTEQRNRLFDKARNNIKVKNQEVKVKTSEGEIRTLLMSIEQITSEEDEKLLIFMALDITDRKTFIEEIRRSLAKEKDLNILKTRFISMISHEFRTPLTAIMLSTDLLKRYGDQWKEEDKLKHFDRIQKTVLRMTQLMESVLTIGRMEAGKFDFQPESIDLNSYCKSLSESIEFTATGKVRIFYSYTGNCVDPMIDENLIGLILSNLLNNAVKYSPRGKDIHFDVECNNDYATFIIKDQGIGIPEKDQNNLFKTFFRASNVGSISGYGLGLNIVKRCVDAHKGEINVQSREKQGTTFIVRIPTS